MSPFFINNYMEVALIVLNIILIIIVIILALYFFKNKKDDVKNVCVDSEEVEHKIKKHKHKQKSEPKSERIFEGRFITDEEYQRMTKFKRSDISVLMEEIDKEYEHLKELNK